MSTIPKLPHSIYAIRCKTTGRIYVGTSVKPDERIRNHISDLRSGSKTKFAKKGQREKSQWQIDYDQYGEQDFEFFILERDVPYTESRAREAFWADYYRTTDVRYGYNIYRATRLPPVIFQNGLPPKPDDAKQ